MDTSKTDPVNYSVCDAIAEGVRRRETAKTDPPPDSSPTPVSHPSFAMSLDITPDEAA